MTSVEFEKMLSSGPKFSILKGPEPCIRDLIYDNYAMRFTVAEADKLTKEYTDALAQMMGVK